MSAQKKVLVTGASRGIGKAIIESFAKEGNYLIGTATSIEGAKTIDEIISSNDSSGAGLVLDLNDDNSIEEFFKILKGKDLYPDILVNNAGFTRDNIFLRMKDDEWSDVLNVHLNAQFKIIKNLVKPMLKNKYGRIINLSSAAAAIGNKGQANYVAAKSGIEAMSRTLAREFGLKNITINCVAPGFNAGAELIKFLTSSEADYITGQTIHINGGLFM